MVGDGQNSQSFIVDLSLCGLAGCLAKESGKELILKKNDGQHGMLKGIFMSI